MLTVNKKDIGNVLKSAFESGYSNATNSLSQMTKRKVYFNNFHADFCKIDSINFSEQTLNRGDGTNFLVTTEIFGDVTGKSYLLLSQEEYNMLTASIPKSKDPSVDLAEEFIKEVDNILSASVITRLSNELKLKMYGDIPLAIGKVNGKIEDTIYDDFSDENADIYINSIVFSFEDHPLMHPVFIWVVDSDMQNVLAPNSVI